MRLSPILLTAFLILTPTTGPLFFLAQAQAQSSGDLIKITCAGTTDVNDPCRAVYYVDENNKRHPFPNEKIYFSWYTNFDDVITISANAIAAIPLTESVTYKPGVTMVKFPSVNQVYAVSRGGVLRPIASESVAEALYGFNWNQQIDDISEAFYSHYTIGNGITDASDYDADDEEDAVLTINDNLTATDTTSLFTGATFYVDPDSSARQQISEWSSTRPDDAAALEAIASQPTARWFGDWNDDIEASVGSYVSTVTDTGDLPILVAYNIPNRDCGSYSAGGSDDHDAYLAWIEAFAEGVGEREAVVILEPDATATDCVTDERLALMAEAVHILKTVSGSAVYIDAGHDNWIDADTMAERLQTAGISEADGFALNVSNFYTTEENESYGADVSTLVNDKHFIIDTSRNGNGWNGEWCNPSGRHIGASPSTETGNPLVDAWLWVKPPGESDGTCNGGPSAGTWWAEYALGLVS